MGTAPMFCVPPPVRRGAPLALIEGPGAEAMFQYNTRGPDSALPHDMRRG
jgi:hypothetical protein